MDWTLFEIILKIVIFFVLLGGVAWLFSASKYYWATVASLLLVYVSFWLTYLLFWHIHQMATRIGIVW